MFRLGKRAVIFLYSGLSGCLCVIYYAYFVIIISHVDAGEARAG